MKKLFLPSFLTLLVLFGGTAFSQGLQNEIRVVRPNFSGAWKMNFALSHFKDVVLYEVSDHSIIVIIDQKLPVISVKVVMRYLEKTKDISEYQLYTDGRESAPPAVFNSGGAMAEWKGNKLVVTSYNSWNGRKSIRYVGELELSADGNTLTCTRMGTKPEIGPDGVETMVVDGTDAGSAVFERIADFPLKSPNTNDRKTAVSRP